MKITIISRNNDSIENDDGESHRNEGKEGLYQTEKRLYCNQLFSRARRLKRAAGGTGGAGETPLAANQAQR